MAPNPIRALKRLLAERRELARKEERVLSAMMKVLPDGGESSRGLGQRPASRPRKNLTCPRCERRFALPMHLGRHLAMSHRRRTAA
jgi:hypothetical protein